MNNCEMILAGFGGQGILFLGKVFAHAAMFLNKNISWLPSYGPEMRGGTANCHVKISSEKIGSPMIAKPNVLLVMNEPSLDKFEGCAAQGAYMFVDSSITAKKAKRQDLYTFYIPATEIAEREGDKKLANMVLAGAAIEVTGLFKAKELEPGIEKAIPKGKEAIVQKDIRAVYAGIEYAAAAFKGMREAI